MRRLLVAMVSLCPVLHAAGAAEIRSFDLRHDDDRYHVVSETFIDAPVAAVYDVLVDYDHYERISSVFTDSRYLERNTDGSGIVYTKARGCIAFFCTTVERTERLEVILNEEIVTTVIPERSTTEYCRSRWSLTPERTGTLLRYELEMKPDFWVPPLVGPALVKRALRQGGARAAGRVELLARAHTPG
jgi:hypothetical protein